MTFLIVAASLFAIGYLLWRVCGTEVLGTQADTRVQNSRRAVTARRSRGPSGPDDDPEFLRTLDTKGDRGHDGESL